MGRTSDSGTEPGAEKGGEQVAERRGERAQASNEKGGERGGSQVEVQPIVTGVSEGELVQVSDGLQPGDRVVVSGVDKLRDGARVRVASADGKRERGFGKAGREGRKAEGEEGQRTRQGGGHERASKPTLAGDGPSFRRECGADEHKQARANAAVDTASPQLVPVGTFMN